MTAAPDGTPVPSRREQILAVAAGLFARHGFHGVSIADLGAAVGVSGPALYRHFSGKEALLAEMLVGISERLLEGGRARSRDGDPRAELAALVDFHVEFATREPELIVVQDRDLANLPDEARRRVRHLQRTYVEIWVDTLRRVRPEMSPSAARVAAHGVFGLMNSTPYSAERSAGGTSIDTERSAGGTSMGTERSAGGTSMGTERSAGGTSIDAERPTASAAVANAGPDPRVEVDVLRRMALAALEAG